MARMSKMKAVFIAALMGLGGCDHASAQSSNPFNPDYAWCATQGAVPTRTAVKWGCLTPGAAGQVLMSNGPGANTGWFTPTGIGTVTSVGLAMPGLFSVTGSPITASGTLTASLVSQSANAFFAAPDGSAGTPTFRAMVLADIPTMDATHLPNAGVANGAGVSGTFPTLNIATNAITTTMLANASVSFAKLQANAVDNTILAQMPAHTVKSNITGALANASDNSLSTILDADTASTQGSILYRGASAWNALAPSAGNILQSNGAGANPSWVAPSAAIPAAVGIGHRLTIATGVPVLNANVTSATTVYSTPYQSDLLLLWNGTNFVPTHCAETSQLLSDATKSPSAAVANNVYDYFAWNDAGTCRVTRGPTWTSGGGSNVVRGTGAGSSAIARTNFGILTNANAITNGPAAGFGTYMGSIYVDPGAATLTFTNVSATNSCTTRGSIPIWNMYNRVITAAYLNASSNYSYTAATTRVVAGQSECRTTFIRGIDEDMADASQIDMGVYPLSAARRIGIGLDTQIAFYDNAPNTNSAAAGLTLQLTGIYSGLPGLGVHFLSPLERGDGANAVAVTGANGFAFRTVLKF